MSIHRSASLGSVEFNDDSIYQQQKRLKYFPDFGKTFCDPVHGQIQLHPVCVAIIDTPQFQRLRFIKQTGFLEHVFPGATQNRFSHSLGVCHLAGIFIQDLKSKQPELMISELDILCIKLAGLCHDLGHGPFSHSWERYINITSKRKNFNKEWKHEVLSCNMLDYLLEVNDLYEILERYGIGVEEIQLVKDFILGLQPKDGRKAFLYQIVNNDDSGLDVDKWDYFLRDCHYLGLRCNFEYERLIQFAKVLIKNGKSQICFRDKVLDCVYNVFRTRNNLHRLAYQHKVLLIIEEMILDALSIVDGKINGPSGETLHLWEWSIQAAFSTGETLKSALERYCMLTDSVLFPCLKYASKPDTVEAAKIVRAIEKRSSTSSGFYHHIGMKILPCLVDETEITNRLCDVLHVANTSLSLANLLDEKSCERLTPDDIKVVVRTINWGKGDQNPVDFVHFYTKNCGFTNPSTHQYELSAMLPKSFQEVQIHLLCRRSDSFALRVARWCFENFDFLNYRPATIGF